MAGHLLLKDFAAACALARACHALRPLSRHPELWERFCRAAFILRGQYPIETQLRFYSWSWLCMFLQRRRLRFDGLYYCAVTKLIRGMNEGRGMKEAGARTAAHHAARQHTRTASVSMPACARARARDCTLTPAWARCARPPVRSR